MLYSKKNKNNKKNNNNVNDVNVGFFLFLYIKIWNNDWRLQYWNTSSKKKSHGNICFLNNIILLHLILYPHNL